MTIPSQPSRRSTYTTSWHESLPLPYRGVAVDGVGETMTGYSLVSSGDVEHGDFSTVSGMGAAYRISESCTCDSRFPVCDSETGNPTAPPITLAQE